MSQYEFKETDWKLFRAKLPGWQEAYMEKLCRGYADLLAEDRPASEKFWELEKKISSDKNATGVVAELKRSKMDEALINLVYEGAITPEDLEEFSGDLQEYIAFVTKR